MKNLFLLFAISFVFNAVGQDLQNEKIFYQYIEGVAELHFTIDSSTMISTSAFEDDLVWDVDQESNPRSIQTMHYGESFMNFEGDEMCTVSGQFYNTESKKAYSSILNFYSVTEDKTITKTFTDLYLQRMCYNPTDKNIIGVIGMDENAEFRAAIMDRTTFEITDIALQGKGAFIPLCIQFTPDGKYALIGYGSSGYNGGYTVYDLAQKKEIKRITLKDQPKEFIFLEEGNFIIRGDKSVIIYNKDYGLISRHDIRLPSIHPSGKYGIHFNNEKEAYFYYFETKTQVKLDLPILFEQDFKDVNEYYGYAKFSPNGKQLAIKYAKWYLTKTQYSSDYPSFMVYDIVAD